MSAAQVKIGLEIHCQLTGLATKLFCSCECDYRGKPPNSNICPVCTGIPGSLPLLNSRAVEFAGVICHALGCRIPEEIWFYRKNYYYPDLPKNFQITQYNAYGISSIGAEGEMTYGSAGKRVRIRRVQLEEDPGRLVYESGSMETSTYSLIDYNRAGVPLVEIVTEPDFDDPKDVRVFLDKVTSIVEHLGVCNTKLEGAVRCDANVSLSGGNRVEIKNVTSFADVKKALDYEIARQRTMVTRRMEVEAETRHWDDGRKVTKASRSKEEEQDYRYFPEPDLPHVSLGTEFMDAIQVSMPELPDARKARFMSASGLSEHVAQVLIDRKELADFFEAAAKLGPASLHKEMANWIVTDLMSFVEDKKSADDVSAKAGSLFAGIKAGPEHIADLARLVEENKVNRATAKQILSQIVRTGEMPSDIAKKMQVGKITDSPALSEAVESVFMSEAAAVQDAEKNPNTVNFLLGKVMQATKGRADPKAAMEAIRKKLSAR
ncbi:MAG TPA: Asp-tRNA(Asn)/Glu-tRNA(Gln) amidotransferase subunit GatB [Nitrososphaera sp.]|nr:Asp-tRNA(Asn)/Glu-tRNA(Gln) amidotransferase subunit GatB [Nitrososphaera sp.]